MPLDGDILCELMHRSTDDLHAPAGAAEDIVSRHRRRRVRNRTLGAAATGVAAGTAVGLIAVASPGRPASPKTPADSRSAHLPAVRLTAAQKTLYQLSKSAAGTAQPAGRYVRLAEVTTGPDAYSHKISVIDSRTGDVWTFQKGASVPSELPVARHDSPTETAYDGYPTDPAGLRAFLLTKAKKEQAISISSQARQMHHANPKISVQAYEQQVAAQMPDQSDNDLVFQEAADMLWSPLVGPSLRSALFKVLATTPGVVVNSSARDSRGRAAIKISRVDDYDGEIIATYEKPDGSQVLQSSFTTSNTNGGYAVTFSDVYLSITRTNKAPATSH
jgi:hypothetical protein